MVEEHDGAGTPGEVERLARETEDTSDDWQRAVRDMRAMAMDREENGFETLTIPAGDTTPKPPSSGETERFGLSHLIPGDTVERFQTLYEEGEFTETDVYQARVDGNIFIVTEVRDPDARLAVFVAGAYRMRHAPALVRTATERDEMYSHVRTLDGTHLGTFEHDDVSAFFPDPEEFLAYE